MLYIFAKKSHKNLFGLVYLKGCHWICNICIIYRETIKIYCEWSSIEDKEACLGIILFKKMNYK